MDMAIMDLAIINIVIADMNDIMEKRIKEMLEDSSYKRLVYLG